MNFKGVIFDLDGTLVDSLTDLADSMNYVLEKNGFHGHGLHAYKYFIGRGIRNLVINALPEEKRDEETISRCHEQMVAHYNSNCLSKTIPYEGIQELLHALNSKGLKLSVFSNKADEFTKKITYSLFPGIFEIVRGLTDITLRKPDPSGALAIAGEMNLAPSEIAYLGDTSTDMQTAVNAGMYAVGVLWGFRTKEELLENGAQYLLHNPMELLNLI
jgi:phosphoglycolate phosphatase